MLYLIFFYLIFTSICLWTGILVYSFPFVKKGIARPIIFYCITGLISITAIAQCAVLFFPLNRISFWVIIFLLGVVSLFRRKKFGKEIGSIRENFRVDDKS